MNMKRFLSGALCAVLLLALCPAAAADAPVEISSAEELSLLRETPDGDFVLTADIDMTGIDWEPSAFSGTLDGGDVMMVGDHFYVGRSARTNEEGIRQFCEILEGWGLEGSEVPLEEVSHLKTGVNYIEDNNMLVSGEFIDKPDFAQYNKIVVPEDEAYGANCIWVNGSVIVAEGYPTVLKAVQDLGYKTLVVDTSEYRKVDGGLSCLSLRF